MKHASWFASLAALILALPGLVQSVPSNTFILSQFAITNALTATEIANSCAVTNYGYPTGNVLRYGADRTGVASSATAVNGAICALNGTNGGTIYFPAGIYKIACGTTHTINKQADVRGDGIGATQIYACDATTDVFTATGSSIVFHDFSMGASVTRTAGRYFVATNASSIVNWYNLYALNWFIGIDLEGTNYSIRDVTLVNGSSTSGNGITIGTGASPSNLSDISIVNLKINNSPSTRPFSCIQLASAGDISLIDDELQFCQIGLAVQPTGSLVVASLLAVNTFFDNASVDGLLMQPQGSSAAVVRARFNGCWFSSAGTFGALLDTNTHGGTISGTTFLDPQVFNNSSSGISLAGTGTTSTVVSGGQIAGNTNAGIVVNAAVTLFTVTGARIGPSGSFGANATGITVVSGASNQFVITGNSLCGNTTALSDSSSGTTKNITGNVCYNPTASTLIANTATSPVSWANNTGAPAYVSITGTPTITTITMGGLQIGSTTGTAYVVPQGQTITVNFSAGTANVTYWGVQ